MERDNEMNCCSYSNDAVDYVVRVVHCMKLKYEGINIDVLAGGHGNDHYIIEIRETLKVMLLYVLVVLIYVSGCN
jgi:hypothetical protein